MISIISELAIQGKKKIKEKISVIWNPAKIKKNETKL
jgi:hypothetical protein